MAKQSKRMLFAQGSATQKQISETLSATGEGEGAYEELPLDRVVIDPDNPRHLGLDPANPRSLDDNDPRIEEKRSELEELESMAVSIRSEGVITPIRVYRHGKHFRIAHGERRFLASILAEKKTIPGIVLQERPRALRLQQLIENFQRKDLNLHRRLENIESVITEAKQLGANVDSAAALREITGLGRVQCSRYLTLLKATKDVRDAIEQGKLSQIIPAVEISKIHDPVLRAQAIKQGRVEADSNAAVPARPARTSPKGGRPPVVRVGSIRHTDVARRLIESVAGKSRYKIDWTDPKAVSKVFKKMIQEMEEGKL